METFTTNPANRNDKTKSREKHDLVLIKRVDKSKSTIEKSLSKKVFTKHTIHNFSVRSDEGLILETSALECF